MTNNLLEDLTRLYDLVVIEVHNEVEKLHPFSRSSDGYIVYDGDTRKLRLMMKVERARSEFTKRVKSLNLSNNELTILLTDPKWLFRSAAEQILKEKNNSSNN